MGARPGQIMSMMLRQGIWPVLRGLAAGLVIALLAGRLLASELYEIRPDDPRPLSVVALALLLTAVAACWAPARRATCVDPVGALRSE
jgi:ABC-type lipoprotein release transport system permease subunit